MRILVQGSQKPEPLAVCERALIGSHRSADIPIGGPGVSRIHAEIYRDTWGVPFVRDCGSRNGTRVNGVHLWVGQSRQLHAGDEIKLSVAALRVLELAPARPMVVVRQGARRREVFLEPGSCPLFPGAEATGPHALVEGAPGGLRVGFRERPGGATLPWESGRLISAFGASMKLHLAGARETQPSPAALEACTLRATVEEGELALELVTAQGRVLCRLCAADRVVRFWALLAWLRLRDRGEKDAADEGYATAEELCALLRLNCKEDKHGRPTFTYVYELMSKLRALVAGCFELQQRQRIVTQRKDNEGTVEYRLLLSQIRADEAALRRMERLFVDGEVGEERP